MFSGLTGDYVPDLDIMSQWLEIINQLFLQSLCITQKNLVITNYCCVDLNSSVISTSTETQQLYEIKGSLHTEQDSQAFTFLSSSGCGCCVKHDCILSNKFPPAYVNKRKQSSAVNVSVNHTLMHFGDKILTM